MSCARQLAWVPPEVRFGSAVSPNRPRPSDAALESPYVIAVLRRSRRVQGRVRARWPSAASPSRSPSRTSIIGDILDGRDVLAKSPTGSGKTLAFGVPMLDRIDANGYGRPSALVLAPTRELASQIVDELYPLAHARALKITTVYGGVGIAKQEREARQRRTSSSPRPAASRTCCSAARSARQRRASSSSTRPTACSTWASARPSTASSPSARASARRSSSPRRWTARPAASPREYTTDAGRARDRARRRPPRRRSSTASSPSSATTASTQLVRELRADRDLALVFVRTKHGADRLVKRLGREGVKAVAMHGDKSQRQRERALAQFERGEVDTLVATDVAARGIDVRDISHVINFDPPEDGDTYTHRVGRTARAGRTGEGITFVGAEQARRRPEDGRRSSASSSEFGQTGLLRSERGGRQAAVGGRRARARRARASAARASRTGTGSTSGRYSGR